MSAGGHSTPPDLHLYEITREHLARIWFPVHADSHVMEDLVMILRLKAEHTVGMLQHTTTRGQSLTKHIVQHMYVYTIYNMGYQHHPRTKERTNERANGLQNTSSSCYY